MLGDACSAAGLADLTVEVVTAEGARGRCVPASPPRVVGQLTETGYPRVVLIDGSSLPLEDVVEFLVRSP